MEGKWIMVTYWTPDGEQTLVGKVSDFEKDILEKSEDEFVRFEYVRWLSEHEIEEDDDLDDFEDFEFDDEEAEEEGDGEDEPDDGEDDELIEDFLDEDDDDDEEEIIRLEDDFIFGADRLFYLKREHIISFAPLKDDFQTLWELTIGDIEDLEDEEED